MWRLGEQLKGQCVYVNQEISFIASSAGRIRNIYIDGKNVSYKILTVRSSPDAVALFTGVLRLRYCKHKSGVSLPVS